MAVSHLFNCPRRAVRKLPGPGGAFRNDFRRLLQRFCGVEGGRGGVGGGGMDLALPWSPLDLETNEKLPYGYF